GAARLGGLANFISDTVVVGFTAGVGLLIIASQLGNFLGIDLPRAGSLVHTLSTLLPHLAETKLAVVLVSACTLAAAGAARRWLPRPLYMIVALAVGSAFALVLSAALGPQRTVFAAVGPVSSALPPLSTPVFSFETLSRLAGVAVSITLLSIAQAISIARAIA